MRTIILSDIKENPETIIPYGLNVGKHVQTKVEVLHLIDPGLYDGPYSPYSDSQTFTPSEKMSHEQIVERERVSAEIEINKILSKEGSRLNYPLRIEHKVEVGDAINRLEETINMHPDAILISSSIPFRGTFKGLDELLLFCGRTQQLLLIVPAGKRFIKPASALLVTTANQHDDVKHQKVNTWLIPLAGKVEMIETGKVREVSSDSNTDQNVEGSFNLKKLQNIIDELKPDIIALPYNKESYPGTGSRTKEFIESINKPVLFY